MTAREIQAWSNRWLSAKRAGDVKPFWLGAMLEDFQTHLLEVENADQKRHGAQDDQQQHQGTAQRENLRNDPSQGGQDTGQ
jgi:hypothetical protein